MHRLHGQQVSEKWETSQPSKRPEGYSSSGIRRLVFRGIVGDDSAMRRLFYQQLLLQYERLPVDQSECSDDFVRPECPDKCASWDDVFKLESVLVWRMPLGALRDYIPRLREEYRRLATPHLFAAYASNRAGEAKPDDIVNCRTEAQLLLNEIQRLRLGVDMMNRVRAFLTLATLSMAVVAITIVTYAIYVHVVRNKTPWTCAPLVLAMIGGLFGGFFSLMGRLYKVPCKGDLVDVRQSTAGRLLWLAAPFVSIAEGVIAAMVLFFLFQANIGIFKGMAGVFPDLSVPPGSQMSPPFFLGFPPVELGKLLVWTFLAGFTERLVPDMLGQLADKAKARGASYAQ